MSAAFQQLREKKSARAPWHLHRDRRPVLRRQILRQHPPPTRLQLWSHGTATPWCGACVCSATAEHRQPDGQNRLPKRRREGRNISVPAHMCVLVHVRARRCTRTRFEFAFRSSWRGLRRRKVMVMRNGRQACLSPVNWLSGMRMRRGVGYYARACGRQTPEPPARGPKARARERWKPFAICLSAHHHQ